MSSVRHPLSLMIGVFAAWWYCSATVVHAASFTYTYDAVGRMTGFTLPAGNQVTYTYDANGNRTQEVVKYTSAVDPDGDGLPTNSDNCPNAANPLQQDGDGDAVGNACEDLVSAGTVAGPEGGWGMGNRDGAATTEARFNYLNGVTAGSNGCLYIADSNNHQIRSMCNGTVTTLAGGKVKGFVDGVGTAARFYVPEDLTLSADEQTLYIVEVGNHTVRALDLATNTVTTVAGDGTAGGTDSTPGPARFNEPRGIRRCGATLFVADTLNRAVRAIDLTTGAVTTIAGKIGASGKVDGIGSAARFSAFQQLACVDAATLYVADTGSHTIRKVVQGAAGWTVTTVAGLALSSGTTDGIGTQARFKLPRGIAIDGTTLYVSDSENNRIRAVDLADGFYTVSTLAGDTYSHADGIGAAAGFREPRGLAVSGNTLYVAETHSNVLRAINLTTNAVTLAAGRYVAITAAPTSADHLRTPGGIALDVSGGVYYLADMVNRVVKQLTSAPNGKLTVEKIYGQVEAQGQTDGAAGVATFNAPIGITATLGYVFVTEPSLHVVRRITLADGSVTTIAGTVGTSGHKDATGKSALFNLPYGLEVDGNTLYVSDAGNHVIRAIDLSTLAVTTVAGTATTSGWADGAAGQAQFNGPKELLLDGGALYIADTDNHRIRKWTIATNQVTTLAGSGVSGALDAIGTAAQFDAPRGLATDGKLLYVADSGNALIRSIDPATGEVKTKAGDGWRGGRDGNGNAAGFVMPRGLLFDPDRHALLVVDSFDRNIRWVH